MDLAWLASRQGGIPLQFPRGVRRLANASRRTVVRTLS